MNSKGLIYTVAVCATFLGTANGAQSAESTASAPASLEEIVVSARKRDETLISVPVVITAVSAATMENRGITNLDSLSRVVPQLMIGNQAGSVQGGNISIRGIAGPDSNPFGDQAVSFNIDGMQVAKGFVRRMTDTDIEQVEVLKGPQALFFGKSTPAGIVSYRTADPTKDFRAKVSLGYETEAKEIRAQGYVSGPLTDTLGGRFAFSYSKMDGYLDEATPTSSAYATNSSKNPDSKDYAFRGTLKWNPSDIFDGKLKLNYAKTKNNGPAANTQFISCPQGVRQTGSGLPCGNGDYSVNSSSGPFVGTLPGTLNHFGDGQNFQDQKQFLGVMELNYHPSDTIQITSVTGLYNLDLDQCQNYENDPGIILPSCNAPTSDREFSQEIRLTTDFKGPLNFAGGLFYSDTKAKTGSITYLFGGGFDLLGPGFGGPTTPVLINNYHLTQDGKAYSAYLQAIYKPTDVVEIDVGGRYSYEKKSLPEVRDGGGLSEGGCLGPFGAPGVPCTAILDDSTIIPPQGVSKNWNNFSPEVTVSYRPTNQLTVFGAYKQGFLSGGFNSSSVNFRANPDISYNPEKIKGFEAGVKSLLLDGTLSVNGAAYSYKVTDLQVTSFTNATSTIRNAGAVKIDGVEADFNYKTPLDGFGLHGAVAYNKGKYTSFPGAPCYNGQSIAQGCNIVGGNPQQDLSGTELIRAPKVNASFGAGYDTPIGATLKLGLSADATYSDSYLTDASSAPQSRNPSYTLLDASVRLGDQNDVWQVAFIGRNLSNKHYWVASPNVPFTGSGQGTNAGVLGDRFAAVSRGREFLFQVSYQFGK